MRNVIKFFERSKPVLHWFHVQWTFVLLCIFSFMFQMRSYTVNKAIFCQTMLFLQWYCSVLHSLRVWWTCVLRWIFGFMFLISSYTGLLMITCLTMFLICSYTGLLMITCLTCIKVIRTWSEWPTWNKDEAITNRMFIRQETNVKQNNITAKITWPDRTSFLYPVWDPIGNINLIIQRKTNVHQMWNESKSDLLLFPNSITILTKITLYNSTCIGPMWSKCPM